MFKFHYASEKFTKAIYYLATGKGDVRSRLLPVFQEALSMITLEKLPPQCHDDWRDIQKLISKYKEFRPGELAEIQQRRLKYSMAWHPDDPDPVEATLKRITNQTGEKIARKILAIENCIECLYRDHNRD